MSEEKNKGSLSPLQTQRGADVEVVHSLEQLRKALTIRDPISGFFHSLGSKAATHALQRSMDEANALAGNLTAQDSVLRAMMRLRDTADDYRAQEELGVRRYDVAKARANSKMDQELAQMKEKTAEARHLAEFAKTKLKRELKVRPQVLELARTKKDVDLAEYRSQMPEKKAEPAPASDDPIEKLQALLKEGRDARYTLLGKGDGAEKLDKLERAIKAIEDALKALGVST
jgi:hypothetical protein